MQEHAERVKLAARAARHAENYADTRIAELEHALNHLAHKQETDTRQHLTYRLVVHLAGLTIAIFATLVTLGIAVPIEVKLALPFLPSAGLEIIDKLLKF